MEAIKVCVVGGSIGGLATGLALLKLGCDVNVYERSSSNLESRGAGLGIPPDLVKQLLSEEHFEQFYDFVQLKWSRVVKDGESSMEAAKNRVTNYDLLFGTLRKAFPDDRYHKGHILTGIEQDEHRAIAKFEKINVECDLLVCADGAHSQSRSFLFPKTNSKSRYVGYILWRGLVKDSDLTEKQRQYMHETITFWYAPDTQLVMYPVPYKDKARSQPPSPAIPPKTIPTANSAPAKLLTSYTNLSSSPYGTPRNRNPSIGDGSTIQANMTNGDNKSMLVPPSPTPGSGHLKTRSFGALKPATGTNAENALQTIMRNHRTIASMGSQDDLSEHLKAGKPPVEDSTLPQSAQDKDKDKPQVEKDKDSPKSSELNLNAAEYKDKDKERIGRRINWAWYYNLSPEELKKFMVDKAGKEHFTIISPGHVKPERVAKMHAEAKALFPKDAVEIMLCCKEPFIQPVFDYMPEKLVNGRCVLLGDAAKVARPHTGAGATSAMEDAITLATLLETFASAMEEGKEGQLVDFKASNLIKDALVAYEKERLQVLRMLVRYGATAGDAQQGIKRDPLIDSESPPPVNYTFKGHLAYLRHRYSEDLAGSREGKDSRQQQPSIISMPMVHEKTPARINKPNNTNTTNSSQNGATGKVGKAKSPSKQQQQQEEGKGEEQDGSDDDSDLDTALTNSRMSPAPGQKSPGSGRGNKSSSNTTSTANSGSTGANSKSVLPELRINPDHPVRHL